MSNNQFVNRVTVSRVFSKPDFQQLRKDFKKQGFDVVKITNGYELRTTKGLLLLKAMNGMGGYLVRYVKDFFE